MGTFFRYVTNIVAVRARIYASLLLIPFLITACSGDSSSKRKVDDLQVSNAVQDVLNKFNACDKSDAEQNISDQAIANLIQIFDEIETADLQYLRCDGSIAKEERGAVRRLEFLIPNALDVKSDKEIQFVKIENQRTCSTIFVSLKNDIKLVNVALSLPELKDLNAKKVQQASSKTQDFEQKLQSMELHRLELQEPEKSGQNFNPKPKSDQNTDTDDKQDEKDKPVLKETNDNVPFYLDSALLADGRLQFKISDSNLKVKQEYLNVKDGNNVIRISFMGPCKEFSKGQSNSQERDLENCKSAEEIFVKEVLLQVKVKRPEVNSTYTFDICESK